MIKKSLTTFIIAFVILVNTNLKAQDDANCGIYIDGTLVDKIDCWTFGYMYLIFPIREDFKKYDLIQLQLIMTNDKTNDGDYFTVDFSPQSFGDNFKGGEYGVWKFFTENKTDGQAPNSTSHKWDRKEFSRRDYYKANNKLTVRIVGSTQTGYSLNVLGERVASYGNGIALYKTEKIDYVHCRRCPWDPNAPCTVTGQKKDFKIEKSPAYNDQFGIIKPIGNSSGAITNNSTPGNTSSDNTKTSVAEKNSITPKASLSPANALTASSVKPLDKIKAGYFAEKNGSGKITREGYKKGNEVLIGEIRLYNDDGKLQSIATYINDVQTGYAALYNDETGYLKECGNYKSGQKDGEWKRYKNGKLVGTDTYIDGEKQ